VTILLPRLHRATDYALRPVKGSRPARSAVGAARQPNGRGGDHWAMEIASGALKPLQARELAADVLRGAGERVRAYVPMHGIDVGAIGLPKVNGANQLGSSLITDGWQAQTAIRKGWMFNILFADALQSLHLVTAEVVANGSGAATIGFWPPMRDIPADNASLEFAEPFIEGLIDEPADQESGLVKAILLGNFVIEEDA
jgi:hypothetical protein